MAEFILQHSKSNPEAVLLKIVHNIAILQYLDEVFLATELSHPTAQRMNHIK